MIFVLCSIIIMTHADYQITQSYHIPGIFPYISMSSQLSTISSIHTSTISNYSTSMILLYIVYY